MNQFQGLMFLQGHFTRHDDLAAAREQYGARTAAQDFAPALGNGAAAAAWRTRAGRKPAAAPASSATPQYDLAVTASARRATEPRGAASLLSQLWYLGGRPMHAGQNLDLDEPFDVPAFDADQPQRSVAQTERRRDERRSTPANLQPQVCTG